MFCSAIVVGLFMHILLEQHSNNVVVYAKCPNQFIDVSVLFMTLKGIVVIIICLKRLCHIKKAWLVIYTLKHHC